MGRRNHFPLLLALVVAPLAAACGGLEQEVSGLSSAIFNGAVDHDHDAVSVLIAGKSTACSATLIGRQTVLTAAHCVQGHWPVHLFVGGLEGSRWRASQVVVHPEYGGGNRADLALIRLEEALSAVEPLKLAGAPPEAGEAITLLGYGKTDANGQFGTRRRALNRISAVQQQTFIIEGSSEGEGNLCDGDSGGPSLAWRGGQEVLVGVHTTARSSCGVEGTDMRVDRFAKWISHAADDASVTVATEPAEPVDPPTTPAPQQQGEIASPATTPPAATPSPCTPEQPCDGSMQPLEPNSGGCHLAGRGSPARSPLLLLLLLLARSRRRSYSPRNRST